MSNNKLAEGALLSIQRLLDDGGIPRGTFVDDQVRNLVALYNQRGDKLQEVVALAMEMREAISAASKATKMQCYLDEYPGPTGKAAKMFYAEKKAAEKIVCKALTRADALLGE